MRDIESRRLRLAVTQLATCSDEDVEWIMSTLSPSQRERLATLVEDAEPLPAPAVDDGVQRIEVLLHSVDGPLSARLRLSMGLDGGDGRLTAHTREILGEVTRDIVAQLPPRTAMATTPSTTRWTWRGLGRRLRRGARG